MNGHNGQVDEQSVYAELLLRHAQSVPVETLDLRKRMTEYVRAYVSAIGRPPGCLSSGGLDERMLVDVLVEVYELGTKERTSL